MDAAATRVNDTLGRLDMTIRGRTDADLPALVSALSEVQRIDAYPVDPRLVTVRWLRDGEAPGDPAWVAVVAGRVVGQVAVARRGRRGEVRRLFVAPSVRGRGVASALMAAAEGLPRPLLLEVVDLARDAIELYQRRGWACTGEHVADWLAADGRPARLLTYELA